MRYRYGNNAGPGLVPENIGIPPRLTKGEKLARHCLWITGVKSQQKAWLALADDPIHMCRPVIS
ncbi:hypothetical protein [Sphingobium psychrophilum]|uniref:hypothetical protein n=1 Tax=Sphingobium psychrophilum TaxID=2728834 RepID=UPI001469BB25|nr:hypothetical protein [Sphingobium psychrophilum]